MPNKEVVMPVDHHLTPLLAQPGPDITSLNEPQLLRDQAEKGAQALLDSAIELAPPVDHYDDVEIPVDGGAIRARIFRPLGEGPFPVHLFFHGGAFTVMSAYTPAWLNLAQERAALASQIVVTVDYRKAPEHKFPTPLNDAFASLEWVARNIHRFGGDATRLSVGGSSAGGNLAAALTIKSRDELGPRIEFQLLEVPALDLRVDAPYDSRRLFGKDYMLHDEELEMALTSYLPDQLTALDPYASPLLATKLTRLPPALILVAQYDVLSDDGILYARRLNRAGVPARLSYQLGHTHFSSLLTQLVPSARAWRDEAVGGLLAINARE